MKEDESKQQQDLSAQKNDSVQQQNTADSGKTVQEKPVAKEDTSDYVEIESGLGIDE